MATALDNQKKKQLVTQQAANQQNAAAAVQNQNAQQKALQTQSNGVQLPKNNQQTGNWTTSKNGYSLYQTPEYEGIDYASRVNELGGGTYQPSQNVQAAQQYLQGILSSKPGAYQSNYGQQLNDLYQQIMNRGEFKYDINADALYQQAKDQYTMMGQNAMRDTMAQAAAMTGGYGNSYAVTAGQQALQGYMQQLSQLMPEYYDRAYQRYTQEGQNLVDKYNLTQAADQMDYAKYRDTVGDWQSERAYAQGAYEGERSFDFNNYATQLNKAMNLLGYERDDSIMNFDYQRDDGLRAESYGYQDYARDQEFAQQEKMFEKQAALEREMLAAQQAYQDSVRQEGYAREDTLLQNSYDREDALRADDRSYNEQMLAMQREYEDALRKEGYAREDQLLADERGYNQQMRDDERAYNQYLTQDQRDYNQQLTQDQRAYEAGLRQEGYSREDQQLMQQQAYSVVMSMITSGVMPSAEYLALAGIGEADALALAKKYGYKEGGSGGSGSSGSKGNEDPAPGQNTIDRIKAIQGIVGKINYADILGKATGGSYATNLGGSGTGSTIGKSASTASATTLGGVSKSATTLADMLKKLKK